MIIERKIDGFVQGKNTAKAWMRMKNRGIILPPFQIQESLTRLVYNQYVKYFSEIEKVLTARSMHTGTSIADAEYLPMDYRKLLARLNEISEGFREESFQKAIDQQFDNAQEDFFKNFVEDASARVAVSISFALESDKIFKRNLGKIKEFYLDNAMKRIEGGQSDLRKSFIKQMSDWVAGKSDLSGLGQVIENIKNESFKFSQFFARDQFARFNKANTLASFDKAGVKKLKWWTMKDGRVRKAHKVLHGNIYDVDKLPEEAKDYNCRCAFLPVFE